MVGRTGYSVDDLYTESVIVTHAGKLNGGLTLIASSINDNVDPSAIQFIQASNEANEKYEFLYMLQGGHVCGISEYCQRRQRAFFKRHLRS